MAKLSNKTKVVFFILFNLVSLSLVFYFTFTPETVTAFANFNYPFLAVLLLVWFTAVSIEAVSFLFFIKGSGTGVKLSFPEAFQLTLIKNMFNVITPLNMGGHPVAIYALSRRGIHAGRGTSIVLTKMIVFSFVSLVGSITAFYFYSRDLEDLPIIRTIFLVSAGVFFLLIFLFFLMLSNPNKLISALSFFGRLIKGRKAAAKGYKTMRKVLVHEVFMARKSIRLYFNKNRVYFFGGLFFTVVFYCINVALLWVILRGMGLPVPFLQGCMLSAVQQAILAFQPVPGGAGIGDGTFYLLFQMKIPKHLMGIAILQWRFFSQYLSAIVGSLCLGYFFSKKRCISPA